MASIRFLVRYIAQLYKYELPKFYTAQMNRISYLGLGPSLGGMLAVLLFTIYLVRICITKKKSHIGMKGPYGMILNYGL